MGMNVKVHGKDSAGGLTQEIWSTDHAIHTHLVASDITPSTPFDEVIYTGSAAGVKVISGGLENYTYWQFQIAGATAAETVQIDVSLDGYNFVTMPLLNVVTGAVQANPVAAACMVRFGTQATSAALNDNPFVVGVKAIKITRVSAGAVAVTVHARGM